MPSSQTLIYLVIGIAVLGLLIVRNLRAQPVRQVNQRLFLVLGVIGVIETYQYLANHRAGATAVGALAGSLVLAAVFGLIRAMTVRGGCRTASRGPRATCSRRSCGC